MSVRIWPDVNPPTERLPHFGYPLPSHPPFELPPALPRPVPRLPPGGSPPRVAPPPIGPGGGRPGGPRRGVASAATQPAAQAVPSESSAFTWPQTLTEQQWGDISAAVDRAFAGIQGGETNQQIATAIAGYLSSTGRWAQQEIAVVVQAALSVGGHTPSFRQQGGNPAPFEEAWITGIKNALNAALLSNNPPPGTAPGSGTSGSSATDPLLASLLGAATGSQAQPSTPQQPVLVPTSGGSSGGTSWLFYALIAGAGGLVYVWWRERKRRSEHGHGEG